MWQCFLFTIRAGKLRLICRMKPRSPVTLEVCILAGGLSRRMGSDKSRLKLGGRTLLARLRATAKSLGFPVRVIRRDAVPRCGPLGGTYTALKTTDAEAVLFLACDMPFVSPELLRAVCFRLDQATEALFVDSKGRPGFPFLLRRRTFPMVARQIERGELSLHELARRLKAGTFRPPPNWQAQLSNVNTPEEWAAVVRVWNRNSDRSRGKRVAPNAPRFPAKVEQER